jgi:5-methylcytosine-specific restriction endonuclease McrA
MSARKRNIRIAFRTAVLSRDQHRCKGCGAAAVALDPHHITDRNLMPHGGYVPANGITLCERCHWLAETRQPGYLPEDLYRLIGSSQQLAEQAART